MAPRSREGQREQRKSQEPPQLNEAVCGALCKQHTGVTMELVAFANVESYFTLRFEGTELCSFLRFVEI
jgi:hypothetical protein